MSPCQQLTPDPPPSPPLPLQAGVSDVVPLDGDTLFHKPAAGSEVSVSEPPKGTDTLAALPPPQPSALRWDPDPVVRMGDWIRGGIGRRGDPGGLLGAHVADERAGSRGVDDLLPEGLGRRVNRRATAPGQKGAHTGITL